MKDATRISWRSATACTNSRRAKTPERWSGKTRDWTPVETVTLNPKRTKTESHDRDQAGMTNLFRDNYLDIHRERVADPEL